MSILTRAPGPPLRNITWSVLPLVAGLFVLVQGVENTGVLGALTHWASQHARTATIETAFFGGALVGIGSNLINNLPMGLLVATLTHGAQLPGTVTGALLIGVDVGPNLSVTGSLATILWLVAIRREGLNISAWRFLALGLLLMPLPLLASLCAFLVSP